MKIKLTKGELKAQRFELQRYQRFLPTLQLKKQQLQSQVERVRAELRAVQSQEEQLLKQVEQWVALFAEGQDFASWLQFKEVRITKHNVVGLRISGLKKLEFEDQGPDLLATPPWVDEGLQTLQKAINLQLKGKLLQQELQQLQAELRKTSQRVNLFEKVKIPECRENIRVIQIALGDLQTMAVARAKLAKAKLQERASAV